MIAVSSFQTSLGERGVGLQMNKLEQVSSDHHQMSLTGVVPGLMSRGGGGTLPCDLFHDAFDVIYPLPWTDITFPKLHLQVVIIHIFYQLRFRLYHCAAETISPCIYM